MDDESDVLGGDECYVHHARYAVLRQLRFAAFSVVGLLLAPDLPPAQVASQAGWVGNDYAYDANHPHAVAALTRDSDQSSLGSYTYDANGNMTCRMESAHGSCKPIMPRMNLGCDQARQRQLHQVRDVRGAVELQLRRRWDARGAVVHRL